MADNMLIDMLKGFLFGAKSEEWQQATEAEQMEMLEASGICDYSPEEVQEADHLLRLQR